MKVLIDTSVWSLALRKKTLTGNEKKTVNELKELIKEFRAVIIGPVRQELLSGISQAEKYEILKDKLKYFEDMAINSEDYEKASELYNICRKNGIQGSHIDFLICAVSLNRNISIFSTDKDFLEFSKVIPVRIHNIRVL